jgi:undecaprenyl-diphosphatase
MATWLESIDVLIFKFVNQVAVHPALDQFFPWFTNLQNNPNFQMFFAPIFLGILIFFFRMQAVRLIAAIALVLVLSDTLGARVFKPYFNRLRPNYVASLNTVVRVPYQPKSGSFPSNHTMNSVAVATMFAYYFPLAAIPAFALAFISGYSRMYVGVHYPSDVLGGALFGFLLALIVIKVMSWIPGLRRPEH